MFTREFWKAAAERAVRNGSSVALFALGTTSFTKFGEFVDKGEAIGAGFAFGVAMSLLMSLAGSQVNAKGNPAFTDNERVL